MRTSVLYFDKMAVQTVFEKLVNKKVEVPVE